VKTLLTMDDSLVT